MTEGRREVGGGGDLEREERETISRERGKKQTYMYVAVEGVIWIAPCNTSSNTLNEIQPPPFPFVILHKLAESLPEYEVC